MTDKPTITVKTIPVDAEPYEIKEKTAAWVDSLTPVVIEVCPTCGAEANAACRGCEDE